MDTVTDLSKQLDQFLYTAGLRAIWLSTPRIPEDGDPFVSCDMEVYVRKSYRTHLYEGLPFLDIATICVAEELQGLGLFTNFLEYAESKNMPIFIENVQEKRFQDFFRNREGYTQAHPFGSTGTLCFCKLPDYEKLLEEETK